MNKYLVELNWTILCDGGDTVKVSSSMLIDNTDSLKQAYLNGNIEDWMYENSAHYAADTGDFDVIRSTLSVHEILESRQVPLSLL